MVPIVNEVIALLLDAGAALSDGMAPRFALDDMIAPPAVVLSARLRCPERQRLHNSGDPNLPHFLAARAWPPPEIRAASDDR
jgi:hypothetical protein